MVGDKVETDVLGAIQANLGGTILLSSSSKKLATSRPHLVIQNILELNSLIPPALYNKSHLMDVDESSCSSNASRWHGCYVGDLCYALSRHDDQRGNHDLCFVFKFLHKFLWVQLRISSIKLLHYNTLLRIDKLWIIDVKVSSLSHFRG